MQGQRSAIGSLPDSINFDYGSPTSNVGVDQQICWNNLRNPAESRLSDYRIPTSNSDTSMDDVSQGLNFSIWSVGESSSVNAQNLVSYDEHMAQNGWSSSTNASVGPALRLEEQHYDPTNFVSHSGVNLNLSTSSVVGGPSFVQCSDMDAASQSHDLNDGNFCIAGDDMNFSNSSKPIGFEGKFLSSASSSSDPFASSSGSGGFLVEEDEGRPGRPLDGRRLSCKRKTLEGNAGQSSSGICFSRAEGGIWHTGPPHHDAHGNGSVNVSVASESSGISPPEQVNPRLGLGMGVGVPDDSICPLSVSGGPEPPQRNHRLRVNPSIQRDTVPNSSFLPAPSTVAPCSDTPIAQQPFRFVPMSPLDLMSAATPSDNSVPPNPPVIMRVPGLRRNAQTHRWNGAPNLRPGNLSSNAVSGERDAAMPQDLDSRSLSRNISEHPMFVRPPPVEARNSTHNPTNWSLSSANVGITRNIPSSSRSGSASASHTTPGPSWTPHRHHPSQYSRRLSEYVRRSLLSTVGSEIAGQSSSNSQHCSNPASSQEGTVIPSEGSQGRSQQHSRSALWVERQGEGSVGVPYSLRALAAAGDGRSRLVSELRNVLDSMRRGEGLRFEDVMILDQSVVFGMADAHDQHRDMRLDVDSMSYEELLALEERIGNVCTGLSEEKILSHLKQQKYIHTMSDDQIETEPCCICQEVYSDGEDIGTLDCGHDFHSVCVKQWLAHKNLCPICKTTALAT